MILSRSGINRFCRPDVVTEKRVYETRHRNPVGFSNHQHWWCFLGTDGNIYEWVNIGRAIQIIKDELKGEIR